MGRRKAARALTSASLCGQTSPSIAHMWHMPGHTYSKLHRYADAAWQQEASARVDHAHMMRDRVLPDQIHNYAHNNEWLIRDLALVGRVHDCAGSGEEYDRTAAPSKAQHDRHERSECHLGHARFTDILLQYELWKEILDHENTQYFEPASNPEEQLARMAHAWAGPTGPG